MSYGICYCGKGYGCTCQLKCTETVPSIKSTISPSVAEGVAFSDLPTAVGEINAQKRKFFPPRRYLSPSHFETDMSWEEIDEKISTYFIKNKMDFSIPPEIAVFSVRIVTNVDIVLCFDIYCCPTGNDTFIVEFRRVIGCAKMLLKIFTDIRSLIVPESTDGDPSSGDGAGNSGDGDGNFVSHNNSLHDDPRFDHMIE